MSGNYSVSNPIVKKYYNAQVLLRPKNDYLIKNYIDIAQILNSMDTRFFITIEYYPSYEATLLGFPAIPCIIWIKDPRDEEEWRKISTVPLEVETNNKHSPELLLKIAREKKESIQKLLKISKLFNRKVVFAASALSLVGIAEKTYGLNNISAEFLPIPVNIPAIDSLTFSSKPSLCFLGRLDPVKRPWIYFELAKKFKNIDFYVAGKTHFPKLMNPVIDNYRNIDNLIFLDMVTGERKDHLLKKTWGIVNTSIHEALPVSFLEAFVYGKSVISCHNPDRLVEKFGYYTGEILGNGYEANSLWLFCQQIENLLMNSSSLKENGMHARDYAIKNYSNQSFEFRLKQILLKNNIH